MAMGEPPRCGNCGAFMYTPHTGQGLFCPNGCNPNFVSHSGEDEGLFTPIWKKLKELDERIEKLERARREDRQPLA